MAEMILDIVRPVTTITVNNTTVLVEVEDSSSVISLGNSGPQGIKGDIDTSAINAHIDDTTPHPAYDDTPSLTLLFENGLI